MEESLPSRSKDLKDVEKIFFTKFEKKYSKLKSLDAKIEYVVKTNIFIINEIDILNETFKLEKQPKVYKSYSIEFHYLHKTKDYLYGLLQHLEKEKEKENQNKKEEQVLEPSKLEKDPDTSNSKRTKKNEVHENKLIEWDRSEKSLKALLKGLMDYEFIEKDSIENLCKHFYIEKNPKFNNSSNIALEKKIFWRKSQRNLAYLIGNLYDDKIIISDYCKENLIRMHFRNRKKKIYTYESLRSTCDFVSGFDKGYVFINETKRANYKNLYKLIENSRK